MKKLDKIRNREAARVLLVQARGMISLANEKLNDVGYQSSVERQFEDIHENIHKLLCSIVTDQVNEK
jgi:hypothetical protein